MNISQDQLQAFFEITKTGSFTKAASSLGLTQSALSHRIRNLESQLELTLLIRSPDRVKLSEAGKKLLTYCRLQFQLENELLSDIKKVNDKELSGFLRIAGPSSIMWSILTPALGPFICRNPAIQLEMMSKELRELSATLESGEADMVMSCGKLSLSHCEEHYLGDEVSILVGPNMDAKRMDVYLDHDSNDHTTMDFLKLNKMTGKKFSRSYMDDIYGVLAGVESGIGRAVVPLHLIKGRKGLKKIKTPSHLVQPVYLYFSKQPYYSRLHKNVVDTLINEIPKLLGLKV